MGPTYRTQIYGSIALMIIGVLALTIGADVAPDPSLGAALDRGGAVATPVFDPLTLLVLVPFAVFLGTASYYDRAV